MYTFNNNKYGLKYGLNYENKIYEYIQCKYFCNKIIGILKKYSHGEYLIEYYKYDNKKYQCKIYKNLISFGVYARRYGENENIEWCISQIYYLKNGYKDGKCIIYDIYGDVISRVINYENSLLEGELHDYCTDGKTIYSIEYYKNNIIKYRYELDKLFEYDINNNVISIINISDREYIKYDIENNTIKIKEKKILNYICQKMLKILNRIKMKIEQRRPIRLKDGDIIVYC
jgi:hypothetical protein